MDKIRLRLTEAIAVAKDNGITVNKAALAAKLWPESLPSTQKTNLANLLNGNTTRPEVAWVHILCAELGCTADELFGIRPFAVREIALRGAETA